MHGERFEGIEHLRCIKLWYDGQRNGRYRRKVTGRLWRVNTNENLSTCAKMVI